MRAGKVILAIAMSQPGGCGRSSTSSIPAPAATEAHKEPEGNAAMTVTKGRATGHTNVKTYEPMAYDEMADGPSLFENRVTETFTGDIEGEGTVRVIQAARKDGSATFVGI